MDLLKGPKSTLTEEDLIIDPESTLSLLGSRPLLKRLSPSLGFALHHMLRQRVVRVMQGLAYMGAKEKKIQNMNPKGLNEVWCAPSSMFVKVDASISK